MIFYYLIIIFLKYIQKHELKKDVEIPSSTFCEVKTHISWMVCDSGLKIYMKTSSRE